MDIKILTCKSLLLFVIILSIPAGRFIKKTTDAKEITCSCKRKSHVSNNSSILLFGDSITEQYSKNIEEYTNQKITVVRPVKNIEGYCGTSYGIIQCLDWWLDNTKWDIIHFNWGLHDISSKIYSIDLSHQEYTDNLIEIYESFRKVLNKNGSIIWATTTPVPYSYPKDKRINQDVIDINKISFELFGKDGRYKDVIVNDLYQDIVSNCNFVKTCYPKSCDCVRLQNDGVHFSNNGVTFNSIIVSSYIIRAIGDSNENNKNTIQERSMEQNISISTWKILFYLQVFSYVCLLVVIYNSVRKRRRIVHPEHETLNIVHP